jgi:hypothetical protein
LRSLTGGNLISKNEAVLPATLTVHGAGELLGASAYRALPEVPRLKLSRARGEPFDH